MSAARARLAIAALASTFLALSVGPSPAAAKPSRSLTLRAPPAVATGLGVRVRGAGARPRARVTIERGTRRGWRPVAADRSNRRGRFSARFGNFVFIAGSAVTSRTGILILRLSAHGVERARLLPARIVAGRPRLG